MPYASFHAVSIKAGHDAASALNAALPTATRQLHDQAREAETNLDTFRLSGISHAHTLTTTADGATRAVVTVIASYEHT